MGGYFLWNTRVLEEVCTWKHARVPWNAAFHGALAATEIKIRLLMHMHRPVTTVAGVSTPTRHGSPYTNHIFGNLQSMTFVL